jgi:hypothetical protein
VNHFETSFPKTKFIIANCNNTKSHFIYQNLAPLTSVAFSISIQPFFSQISQCSFGLKSNFLGVQKLNSFTLSSSVFQIVAVGSSKFGIW